MNSDNTATGFYKQHLFPNIFEAFEIAIQLPKLIIAFLAITVIFFAGWVMDTHKTVVTTDSQIGQVTELHIYLDNPDKVPRFIDTFHPEGIKKGFFTTLWEYATVNFNDSLKALFAFNFTGVGSAIIKYFKAICWALKYHTGYCMIFLILNYIILTIAGGAICRMAALQFSKGEKPGLTEALRFSLKNFKSFATAPLFPLGVIVFLGACIFVLGLAGKIPGGFGELIMGLFMLPAIIGGFVIAFFIVGLVFGFNLMFPAVAYNGSDCLDAMERSFSYIYQKPWSMGFYTAIAAVYGSICYTFARLFAFLLLFSTHQFLTLGIMIFNKSKADNINAIWPEPTLINLTGSVSYEGLGLVGSVGAFFMRLPLLIVLGLMVAFVISFFFSANTIIYSLMRNKVDKNPLDDVYTLENDSLNHLNDTNTTQ